MSDAESVVMTDLPTEILRALAEAPAGDAATAAGTSLPKLAKRFGASGSALLRQLHMMSAARIGAHAGPGWVHVEERDGRWLAWLTESGRAQLEATAAANVAVEATEELDSDPQSFDESELEDLPAPLVKRPVLRHPPQGGAVAPTWQDDDVAAEVPVALVFNGISHAVMMATPADLHEFALGFALSEGLIDEVADCRSIEVHAPGAAAVEAGMPTACEVHLEISTRCFVRLKDKRRALAGRTGCGICGIDSLEALDILPEPITPRAWADALGADAVLRAVETMPSMQVLNAASGAIHAAGWATRDGVLTDLLEDVGRHNALDKLIGRLAAAGRLKEEGFVVMSSRASYELVRKCSRLDIPLLATVSAPTSLAIDLANKAGLTLWGLCRPPRAVRYTGMEGRRDSGEAAG